MSIKKKTLILCFLFLFAQQFIRLTHAKDYYCEKKLPPIALTSEFQANKQPNISQEEPVIAAIGVNNEKFVAAWRVNSVGEDAGEIYAIILNSTDGAPLTTQFSVNTYREDIQMKPEIAAVGADKEKFVITYQSNYADGDSYGIAASMYSSADGSAVETEFIANTDVLGDQIAPTITSVGLLRDRFVIAWQSDGQLDTAYEIRAQMFSTSTRTKIGEEIKLSTQTAVSSNSPCIASIGSEDETFVIVWQSETLAKKESGIYAQFFDSINGTKIGGSFRVDNSTEGYLSDPTGNKIGSEFQANVLTEGSQLKPQAVSLNNDKGYFLITWTITHENETDENDDVFIRAFFYNSTSKQVETLSDRETRVNDLTTLEQSSPTICLVGELGERIAMAWEGVGQDHGANSSIFVQIFNSTLICNCSTGHYSSRHSEDMCAPCTKGKYQSEYGQTMCLDCPSGYYQEYQGQTFCNYCAIGEFNANLGSSSSGDCLDCKAGTYSNETGQSMCRLCQKGTYQENKGQNGCKACPIGTYNSKSGQDSIHKCLKCATGEYGEKVGAISQEDGCEKCSTGTYNPNEGSESSGDCLVCGRGTFQNQSGQSICLACFKGHYQNLEGQVLCQKCNAGTYNPNEGSVSSADCLDCQIGRYNDHEGKSSCALCGYGNYSSSKGMTNCLQCSPGSYSDTVGATVCQYCGFGTYQNQTGKAVCEPCSFNTYADSFGNYECQNCPTHSETLSTKSQSSKKCFCTVGYYGSAGENCQKCHEHGVCTKFNQQYPYPQLGYWGTSEDPTRLIKCQVYNACPGYEMDKCNKELGYTGIQCSECDDGFYKVDHRCKECPQNPNQPSFLYFFILLLILVIFVVFTRKISRYFKSLTIVISFFQVLALIYQLKGIWPKGTDGTFQLFLPFNLNIDLLATECSSEFGYFKKWKMIQLLPIVFLLFFVLIYILLLIHSKTITTLHQRHYYNYILNKFPNLMKKPSKLVDHKLIYYLKLLRYYLLTPFLRSFTQKEVTEVIKSVFTNVYLTLLSMLYLTLSQKCLEIFSCEYNAELNKYIFKPDANYYCFDYDQENNSWNIVFPFAITCSVLYIIGIPLLILYLLIKNSKRLTEKQFDLKLGLLYSKYNKAFFFWEIIIMLRKLFLVIIRVVLIDYPKCSITLLIFVLLLALLLQFKYRPYIEKRHNNLDSILLIFSQVILFSGLIFESEEINNNSKETLYLVKFVKIMVLISVFFILIAAFFDIKFKIKKGTHHKKSILNKDTNIMKLLNSKVINGDTNSGDDRDDRNNANTNNNSHKNMKKNHQQENQLNLLILLKWLMVLNNSKSKKINLIFAKILNNKQKNKQSNILKTKYNQVFLNNALIIFARWYKKVSNINQKIQVNYLLTNFSKFR
ncbi:insulin-like growth factor binding protein [Anaeramoeba flamelloides]|uniref:Insulin-like growth factor binding protein n=1 Tax=Anaeramoeba flamelloides TaxID=1746091 RepID=A0ABQ8Z8K5_9EUKA|nr:insulin-like growth factor binding protein [Anaeramoeba flamelloides]